jgi:REP element-mobilizing transposase RayT
MPIEPLLPGHFYHIYNRGNNRENVFVEARNYPYFLNLYIHHVEPIAELLAYCLLKNHFHLLIKIKENSASHRDPSRCFSNMFNAYARSFNHAYGRTGALFQRPFKRKNIVDERQFTALVVYIHRNPQKHGFVSDFRDWPYSSYQSLSSTRPTRLPRDTVTATFGSEEAFIAAHRHEPSDSDVIGDDNDD